MARDERASTLIGSVSESDGSGRTSLGFLPASRSDVVGASGGRRGLAVHAVGRAGATLPIAAIFEHLTRPRSTRDAHVWIRDRCILSSVVRTRGSEWSTSRPPGRAQHIRLRSYAATTAAPAGNHCLCAI